MKKIVLLFALLLLINSISAQKVTLSGYIYDHETGENLIGVNVYELNSKQGTVSNKFGFFSLQLNENDSAVFKISFIGYKSVYLREQLSKDITKKISLKSGYELNEVSVTAESLSNSDFNIAKLSIKQVENLPSLTGEKDILKAYTLLPGVQSGNEGSSELYVRGGSPDQNLILLDDVPVYYLNHLGGFLSIFDENAIKSMELIKGGFPARYGGRLSSIVDIRLKEGNSNEFKGELNLGLISSRISLEGPLSNNKTTYLFSARRCNVDLFSRLIFLIDPYNVSAGYTFYDVNSKITHRFSQKSTLSLNIYNGRDKLFINVADEGDSDYKYWNKQKKNWGNLLTSLQWNYQLGKKLYMNSTLAHTRFKYYSEIGMEEKDKNTITKETNYENFSSVNDIVFKTDFDYFLNPSNRIKFGVNAIFHDFQPGKSEFHIKTEDIVQDTAYGNTNFKAIEYAAFAENEIKIGKHFNANLGAHFTAYSFGNETDYSIQPRLNVNILINKNNKLNLSYAKMSQYLHLLSSSGAGIPTNLWVPANLNAPRENSLQYSAGFSHFFEKNELRLSVEGFYKELDNLIEIKNETNFFMSEGNWDEKIETKGTGEIYGAEFLLQKQEGDLTGWIAYTWSKNTRQFDNLNSGKPYYFNYDRRHDISIVANYKLKKNINLSATWVFATGYPITLGLQRFDAFQLIRKEPYDSFFPYSYNEGSTDAYIYTEKNNYRMRPFHKLDVSISFDKKVKKGIRTWNIAIYNAYCRMNSYYVYVEQDYNNDFYDNYDPDKIYEKEYFFKSFTLFPIIPSFSYSLKF